MNQFSHTYIEDLWNHQGESRDSFPIVQSSNPRPQLSTEGEIKKWIFNRIFFVFKTERTINSPGQWWGWCWEPVIGFTGHLCLSCEEVQHWRETHSLPGLMYKHDEGPGYPTKFILQIFLCSTKSFCKCTCSEDSCFRLPVQQMQRAVSLRGS